MIMDKLGKFFEERRKKNIPVEVERRKEENKIRTNTQKDEKKD